MRISFWVGLAICCFFVVVGSSSFGNSTSSLVGKWQHTTRQDHIEFFPNGRIEIFSNVRFSGDWSLVDATHVRINLTGKMGKANFVLVYHVVGDQLTLHNPAKPTAGKEYYKRVQEFKPIDKQIILNEEKILKQVAHAVTCQQNLKSLGLAAAVYASEHGGKLSFTNANYRVKVKPYATPYSNQHTNIFFCPANNVGSVSYSFNESLRGSKWELIKNPSKVVLFYEGTKGQLVFRHHTAVGPKAQGATNVCYADGHIKRLTQQEAKSLRWKP